MRKVFSLSLLFLFLVAGNRVSFASTTMTAELANSIFANGNAAYRAQKYEEAANSYKQLLEAGYKSVPVLYNAGTTSARLGKKGEAIGYLMRARSLAPRDESVAANLEKVSRPDDGAKAADVPGTSLEKVWDKITSYFTSAEWLLMIWIAFVILCLGITLRLVLKRPQHRSFALGSIWISAAVLLLLGIPAAFQIYKSTVLSRSVAITPASVLSGPAERFTSLASLPEGQVVQNLRNETDGYLQVRLDNGLQGYVRTGQLMQL